MILIDYRAIVTTVLKIHLDQGPCLFEPGAVDKITNAAIMAHMEYRGNHKKVIDAIEAAFIASEIYCPHENIDKRAEFGLIS
jgi:hypothetical protein